MVIVATVRALKMHGGLEKENLKQENIDALKTGYGKFRKTYREYKKIWFRTCSRYQSFYFRYSNKELNVTIKILQRALVYR